ncbi:cupin domain-containing protein [Synechococcus sp. PCC 6717]|nr:cupin domain-containing protein [Synechococcus sp. PCC 6717]
MNSWQAEDWVRALQLQPHPEGGYFREVYRAAGTIPAVALPPHFAGGDRAYSTSIYRSDVGGLKPLRFSEGIQPTQGALALSMC